MAVQQLLRDAGLNDARSRVAYQVLETRQTADRRISQRFPVPIAFAGLIGLAMIRAVAPDPSLGLPLVAIAGALVGGVVYAIPPLLISGLRWVNRTGRDGTPGQRARSRPAGRAVDLQRDVRYAIAERMVAIDRRMSRKAVDSLRALS